MIKKNLSRRFISIFSITLLILSALQTVHAAPINEVPPGHWRADFWRFSVLGDYFTTHANFAPSGSQTYNSIPSGNKLQVYELRPKLRYNLTDRASVYVGGGFVDANSTTGAIVRNNSSASEAFVGADYIFSAVFLSLATS